MTRGSPNRKAGALLPSAVSVGSATRSKAGLARTPLCPTRSVLSMRALTSRPLACSSSRFCRRRRQRRSVGELMTVSIRSARLLLDPGVLVEGAGGDQGVAGDDLGLVDRLD